MRLAVRFAIWTLTVFVGLGVFGWSAGAQRSAGGAGSAAAGGVPAFEVDAAWPKPLMLTLTASKHFWPTRMTKSGGPGPTWKRRRTGCRS